MAENADSVRRRAEVKVRREEEHCEEHCRGERSAKARRFLEVGLIILDCSRLYDALTLSDSW